MPLYPCMDPRILTYSQIHSTVSVCLWVCTYSGMDNLLVVPVTSILSVISMQPLPKVDGDPDRLFFVVEKSGLDNL